jgi:amphi-Trp domain-containing protein
MDFRHEERLGRRRAAERLADVAYALGAGMTLELRDGGGHVRVPVPEEVVLRRTSTATDGRVRVVLELSWSTPTPPDPGGHHE